MPQNPLFPDDDTPDKGYVLPGKINSIEPISNDLKSHVSANPAADIIREKLAKLYAKEPNTLQEEREVEHLKHRSKHQQFMYDLSTSSKSLAEIQTEWHNYYVALPDDEKHQVWQEFYENNVPKGGKPALNEPAPHKAREFVASQAEHRQQAIVSADHTPPHQPDSRPASAVRRAIREQVERRTANLSHGTRQNIKSLAFGLSVGFVALVILLFGFFNEVIIAPFIQPGRANATPIIVSSSSINASQPRVIIPKINADIPLVYGLQTDDESVIENALQDGVVHYPTTVSPGQQGNAAFFGHSSNNIFNKGKYKFAFVLLHKLEKGDTFYLTYNNNVYGYIVISKQIVPPSNVSVLNNVAGETATATLITCDPPGTSLNRLVVVGRQVSPDPSANSTATPLQTTTTTQLVGNGPTLWTRFWRAVF